MLSLFWSHSSRTSSPMSTITSEKFPNKELLSTFWSNTWIKQFVTSINEMMEWKNTIRVNDIDIVFIVYLELWCDPIGLWVRRFVKNRSDEKPINELSSMLAPIRCQTYSSIATHSSTNLLNLNIYHHIMSCPSPPTAKPLISSSVIQTMVGSDGSDANDGYDRPICAVLCYANEWQLWQRVPLKRTIESVIQWWCAEVIFTWSLTQFPMFCLCFDSVTQIADQSEDLVQNLLICSNSVCINKRLNYGLNRRHTAVNTSNTQWTSLLKIPSNLYHLPNFIIFILITQIKLIIKFTYPPIYHTKRLTNYIIIGLIIIG